MWTNMVVVKREYAIKWRLDCGLNIVPKIKMERSKSAKCQAEWNRDVSHKVFWDDLV